MFCPSPGENRSGAVSELMVRELADQGSIEKVGVLVLKPTFVL